MNTANTAVHENERELKNLLTQEEYEKLFDYFGKIDTVLQVNYYYDTDEFDLNRQNVVLRTRQRKGAWELTLKEDAQNGGRDETHHRPLLDEERKLLTEKGIVPAGPVLEALRRFTDRPIKYLGQLSTGRATFEVPHIGEVMLDNNLYAGTLDYEIELEIAEGTSVETGEKYFTDLLANYGIKRKQAPGKLKRFIKRKTGK